MSKTDKAPPRKRDVLTKAQWEKIARAARDAEADPDERQLSLIQDATPEPST